MNCCICGVELTGENTSIEHIIPNAIGGRLTSKNIFCKQCNSNFGTAIDSNFVKIFQPIQDFVKIDRDRKTKGGSYSGFVFDKFSKKIYEANIKNGKITSMFDENKKTIIYDPEKHKILACKFNLDNNAFKRGLAKISFDFAIEKGLSTTALDEIFDIHNKTIKEKITIIPFIPLTSFDVFMESNTDAMFHLVRLFNCDKFLFTYIELFSTFQFYILLSKEYTGSQVDEIFCQKITKEVLDEENIKKSFEIRSREDMDIISGSYGIDVKEVKKNLKNTGDVNEDFNNLFEAVSKQAFENYRKSTYEIDYYETMRNCILPKDLIHIKRSRNLNFLDLFYFYENQNSEKLNDFYKKYIKINGKKCIYPNKIASVISAHSDNKCYKIYGYYKFCKLMGLQKK